MKEYSEIIKELTANGYKWSPQYKNIDKKIWTNMAEYFNEDETVLSALFSTYNDTENDMIAVLFITSQRTFTLDMHDDPNSSRIRYIPHDAFSSNKLQVQYSKSGNSLNYISLDFYSGEEVITFACPNKNASKHFVETLKGATDIEYDELPESDDPLISKNKKEQLIDEDLKKVREEFDHNFNEKHPDEIKREDSELWKKAPSLNQDKEVEIKTVGQKEFKQKRKKADTGETISPRYGTKWKNKIWLLYYVIPLGIIGVLVACFVI